MKLRDTDFPILRQAYDFGFTTEKIVTSVFGQPAGHWAKLHHDAGNITRGKRGTSDGFQTTGKLALTTRGASVIGIKGYVPPKRSVPLALARLYFCCGDMQHRRYPLVPSEVTELLGKDAAKNVSYVLEDAPHKRVLRLFVSSATIESAVAQLRKTVEHMSPSLQRLMDSRDFGIGVIAHSPERLSSLRKRLSTKQAGDSESLAKRANMVFAVTPSPKLL